MPNMSYCRFQNTARDLADCIDALDDNALFDKDTSEEEKRAAKRLIRMCNEISENYGHEA